MFKGRGGGVFGVAYYMAYIPIISGIIYLLGFRGLNH